MKKRHVEFRTLKANEIEVRPQSLKNGKAKMLLYIDSRAATELLDETVGNLNWQSDFYEVNGKILCKIGIYDDEKNCWVWKSDTGSESNVESDKGQISDCYKRVLSRFGVTELYSAPQIMIDDDGYKCTGYKVSEIQYDDRRQIIHLVIVNKRGEEVYRWSSINTTNAQNVKPNYPTHTPCTNNFFVDDVIDELEWSENNTNYVGALTPSIKPIVQKTNFKHNVNKENPLQALTEFCSSLENQNEDVQNFFNYYQNKISSGKWSGTLRPKELWSKWTPRS